MTNENDQCCRTVFGGGSFRGRKCAKKATVTGEDGNRYCITHEPKRAEARREKSYAKFNKKWALEQKQRILEFAAPDLLEACKKANTCASLPDSVRELCRAAIAKAEGTK